MLGDDGIGSSNRNSNFTGFMFPHVIHGGGNVTVDTEVKLPLHGSNIDSTGTTFTEATAFVVPFRAKLGVFSMKVESRNAGAITIRVYKIPAGTESQTLDAGSTNLFAHYNIPGGLNNQVLSAGPHYATPAKAHLDAGDVIEVSMDSAGSSAQDVSFTFVLFFDTSSPVTRPAIEP